MNINNYIILLVEDDPNDVILIKRAFYKANIVNPIRVVENGEEAIVYLTGDGKYITRDQYPLPMLMLLDLRLPRKSGFEVLAWVRQQPGLKRLPIVVLTSLQRTEDINRAYDLGANSYLIKPTSFKKLLSVIKNINTYWLIQNKRPEINS